MSSLQSKERQSAEEPDSEQQQRTKNPAKKKELGSREHIKAGLQPIDSPSAGFHWLHRRPFFSRLCRWYNTPYSPFLFFTACTLVVWLGALFELISSRFDSSSAGGASCAVLALSRTGRDLSVAHTLSSHFFFLLPRGVLRSGRIYLRRAALGSPSPAVSSVSSFSYGRASLPP